MAGLDDDDWAVDEGIADEAERTGVTYSVQEAMGHFRAELHAQVSKAGVTVTRLGHTREPG